MKRIFISLLALIVIAGCNLFAQPKIEILDVKNDTYNWGRVTPKDSPLKAKVKIKNAGNEKLLISEVKPGCGCTVAPIDKNELNPGDVATIDITLRVSGSHEITKTVRISSNDPVNKDKILYLKADIFTPLEVSPQTYFTFPNDMKVGYEAAATVKVKNNSDKDITLSNFEISPESVHVNLKNKKVIKPGEEIEVIAKVKPEKAGYFNCTLKMKTSSPDMNELTIGGYGQVKESPLFNN